ncbi:LysR family transcriptional regulator [Gulosibacter sp. 10]|uniref:LysR family transcriptional regulator n=1 Tax=Gulosibacter sp. 10 TaxID=1255570 RepID=UPI00097F470B|nr:LysR family transcriptional regulator [Gulosibacter sp. 10]SJM56199.1 LysR family transcriptional regulator STM3121 [Gulosibacter sp. 10]
MERRNLEYLRAVADHGSVSDAALRLSVTQPAVSKQIQRLERELGTRLFYRTPQGMSLTAAGETLYRLSERILTGFERMESTIRARFVNRPAFRVAAPATTAFALISPFMAATDSSIVDLAIMPVGEMDSALDAGVDIAISTVPPPHYREGMPVGRLPLSVQAPADVLERAFGAVAAADLAAASKELLIVPQTGVHRIVEQAAAGLPSPLRIRPVSVGTAAQAMAVRGQGIALLAEQPTYGLRSLPVAVRGEPLSAGLYASWDPRHFASPELRDLAEDFSRWFAEDSPWRSAAH